MLVAGAVGFEPTPSALTVQRPTNWTTPQFRLNYDADFIASPIALQQILLGRGTSPVTLYPAINSFAVLII
jgi:hypothetical protein